MNAKLKYMHIIIPADFKKNSDSSPLRCSEQWDLIPYLPIEKPSWMESRASLHIFTIILSITHKMINDLGSSKYTYFLLHIKSYQLCS